MRKGSFPGALLAPSPAGWGPAAALTQAAHHHAVLQAEGLPQDAELLGDLVRQLPAGKRRAEAGPAAAAGLAPL